MPARTPAYPVRLMNRLLILSQTLGQRHRPVAPWQWSISILTLEFYPLGPEICLGSTWVCSRRPSCSEHALEPGQSLHDR